MSEKKRHIPPTNVWTDSGLFVFSAICLETFILIIYAIWFEFEDNATAAVAFWPYARDVSIMIFFGFGFLMAFLRRAGFTAIGALCVLSPNKALCVELVCSDIWYALLCRLQLLSCRIGLSILSCSGELFHCAQ